MHKQLVLLPILLIIIQASLSVYMPQCAVKNNPNPVEYTLAKFGHVPFGKTIIGQIVVPSQQQFCQGLQDQLISRDYAADQVHRFLLIKRGNCKFTHKIINAQKRGIDLVIIYDNQPTSTPNLLMQNDGYGHLVNIPSVFISNTDGKRILSAYNQCEKIVIMKMKFDVKTSKIANITFWLDSSNRATYITIKNFYKDYYDVIKSFIDVTVMFKINQYCQSGNCEDEHCIMKYTEDPSNYCLQNNIKIKGIQLRGKQLINQHLRAYYIFQYAKKNKKQENWWKYMTQFDNNVCLQQLDMKQCSKSVMPKSIDFDTIDKQVQSAKNNAMKNISNPLEMFLNSAYQQDILFYPQATINGRNFYGLFKAPDIFNMLCQSLDKPPKQCYSFQINKNKQTIVDQTDGIWKTVLIIAVIMLVVFISALLVYTKMINREINQQMSVQVNKMVQNYVSMTENSNSGFKV